MMVSLGKMYVQVYCILHIFAFYKSPKVLFKKGLWRYGTLYINQLGELDLMLSIALLNKQRIWKCSFEKKCACSIMEPKTIIENEGFFSCLKPSK